MEFEPTGQRAASLRGSTYGHQNWPKRQRSPVTCAASETFSRWLHHSYPTRTAIGGEHIYSPRDALFSRKTTEAGSS